MDRLPTLGPSDIDREEATARLQAEFAAGRLDFSGFEARLDAILRADSDEEFRTATHDLSLSSRSVPRSRRGGWLALGAAAAMLGFTAVAFAGADRSTQVVVPPPVTVVAPPASHVAGELESQSEAYLLEQASREQWSRPCGASQAVLESAPSPTADSAPPADRPVDLIPPSPWSEGATTFDGVIAPLVGLPKPLAAAVLTHHADRAVGRTYVNRGTTVHATVEVFRFGDAATAQAARRDYFNGAVCFFGAQPVAIKGAPDVLAMTKVHELTATWTAGPHLVMVIVTASDPAAAMDTVKTLLRA